MAITITSGLVQNDLPGLTKNPVLAYKVNTSDLTIDEIRARIFVETTPYSNTYSFEKELKAIPDSAGDAIFYLDDFEENVLQYDIPDLFAADQVGSQVCRRVQTSFYEYSDEDLNQIDEAYQNTSTSADVSIEELATDIDYIIVIDAEEALTAAPEFKDGGANAKSAALLYQLGDEIWYEITADHDYDSVSVEKGKKLTIYEGQPPTLLESDEEGVLLGGKSFQVAGIAAGGDGLTFGGTPLTFGGENLTHGGN